MNDEEISTIYVRLGNDFNVACTAFTKEHIDMRSVLPCALLRVALWRARRDAVALRTSKLTLLARAAR